MKNFLTVLICLICSCLLVFGQSFVRGEPSDAQLRAGVFEQKTERRNIRAQNVPVLFCSGQRIAVLHSTRRLKNHLKELYEQQYAENFPDSRLELAAGYVIKEEPSFFTWENRDDEILSWLDGRRAYALQADGISFSTEDGVTARIYVRDLSLYENALHRYLSFFTDSSTLDKLLNGMSVAQPQNYGWSDVGLSLEQKVTTYRTKASPDQILTSQQQVLDWLEYGSGTEKEYYTVEEGDTLEGIGEKNGGLTPQQLVNINADILNDVNAVPAIGTKLCVTYFESPLTVDIYRDRLISEPLFAENQVVVDQSWPHEDTVIQQGTDGAENILMQEKWVNGIYEENTVVSSLVTSGKKDRIISSSNSDASAKGSGMYRLPVDYASISCEWACYIGHDNISYRNRYDSYGKVYAVDNGTLEESGSDDADGNWILIDHHNGLHSFYGHLAQPCSLETGTVIQKGETIGNIAMTGSTTYPHLTFYFEDDGGTHINPASVSGYPDVSD